MKTRAGRIYDDVTTDDGAARVLVDRLWPRGVSKDRAALDEWCKSVAPSPELRKWYGHAPEKFAEFRRRYEAELGGGEQAEALAHLRELARSRPLLLLTASKDVAISEAAVLAEVIGVANVSRRGPGDGAQT
ncbi:DUF488 family protein [Actinoplanes sp. NPDC048796]|uniref:DUF488 domain-containing protein n=1 Tax=unclassified Actinoplanes TaxID=2626549 RepID=UPI0033D3B7D8